MCISVAAQIHSVDAEFNNTRRDMLCMYIWSNAHCANQSLSDGGARVESPAAVIAAAREHID
jgi:hypothetical protein